MGVGDARIDDGHNDVGIPRREVPGLGGVDVRVDRAAGLAGIVHAPELAEVGVVGDRRVDLDDIIRLGIGDVGILLEGLQGPIGRTIGLIDVDAGQAEVLEMLQVVGVLDLGAAGLGGHPLGVVFEFDQEPVRDGSAMDRAGAGGLSAGGARGLARE